MSPAPASRHQRISWNISFELGKFLDNSPCEVFYAPFDVHLERTKNDEQIQTVVQPDICVICDISKIDEKGCSGAPEVVVEILSPENSKREMKAKYELYEEAGVLEY
ncbi:MAG: Uma2 family endonuclease [Spirosomataceae bacterium]|jgi:Uma2 family endonuclease